MKILPTTIMSRRGAFGRAWAIPVGVEKVVKLFQGDLAC
jgi:hypothetical protein